MKPAFSPAHAETTDQFLDLLKGSKLVVYYVHDGSDEVDASAGLPDVEDGELYLSFDLSKHTEEGRQHFLDVGELQRRLGDPPLRQLPHWRCFVVGMGPYSTAYSIEDARSMLLKARKETRDLWNAFNK